MTQTINLLIILLTLMFFCSISLFAQEPKPLNVNYPVADIKPKGCELNNLVLEHAHEEAGKDTLIILIARPGKKDKRLVMVKRRLHTARAYLTAYLKWRSVETVVVGEAPNNGSNYGVVEIYIKGRLFDVLATNPDAELGLGSCDSPGSDDEESRAKRALLYPWIYKKR